MLYSIKILQSQIDQHLNRLENLSHIDGESYASEIFMEEEVAERKNYIDQLKKAISVLNNADNVGKSNGNLIGIVYDVLGTGDKKRSGSLSEYVAEVLKRNGF